MEPLYAVVRYYKTKKTRTVLHENLTIEKARELCEQYPTKKVRNGDFNSYVGFTKMASL